MHVALGQGKKEDKTEHEFREARSDSAHTHVVPSFCSIAREEKKDTSAHDSVQLAPYAPRSINADRGADESLSSLLSLIESDVEEDVSLSMCVTREETFLAHCVNSSSLLNALLLSASNMNKQTQMQEFLHLGRVHTNAIPLFPFASSITDKRCMEGSGKLFNSSSIT